MCLIYKHNVIYIFFMFVSGFRTLFSQWPASSLVSVLSCELNGQGLSAASPLFSVTFHFQLNYSFFVGRLGLLGLGFRIRVSVTV